MMYAFPLTVKTTYLFGVPFQVILWQLLLEFVNHVLDVRMYLDKVR
jgi:hypothetical protein